MFKPINIIGIAVFFILSLFSLGFCEESMTITTYYPSPYGSYRELRAQRVAFGDTWMDAGTYAWDTDGGNPEGNEIRQDADLVVEGRVGIGTVNPGAALDVVGGILVDLPTIAGGAQVRWLPASRDLRQDMAELFDTNEDVEAGDILCITSDKKLKKSNKVYDTSVAGIVSEAPAIVFEGSRLQILPQPYKFTTGRKPPLALAGRVTCKVSIENGPIKHGDLLTTSAIPGHAMKAADRKKSCGAIVAKALEPFKGGPNGKKTGKIMVLVTLQ